MFEYQVQKAWDHFKDDFGIGRNALFVMFFNTLLFFLSGTAFGYFNIRALYPVAIALLFYLLRPRIIKLPHHYILTISLVPVVLTVILNYYLIGQFDESVGGLTRIDPYLIAFDEMIFGDTAADRIYYFLEPLGTLRTYLYDIFMIAYNAYFFLAIIGLIIYYRLLPPKNHHHVGRYVASIILFYQANYLCYLIFPVTGPQFYQADQFDYALPLTGFGQFLWHGINSAQGTFIDCFPSGHTGITILVTIWMYKINHLFRYTSTIICFFTICATLAMRYHYTLDLICALPLAYFCYRAAFILFPTRVSPQHFRTH